MRNKARPDIFRYHEYHEFLRDWLAHLKRDRSRSSLRSIAKDADLSPSLLSMIVSGERKLSLDLLPRLALRLGLNETERGYLELLVALGNAETQELRIDAYQRLTRYRAYRKQNAKEVDVFHYLTHWYYVAIREMAALPGFRDDPAWIRERLRYAVDTQEIQKALKFLLDNGYLEKTAGGTIRPPAKSLDCRGGVYRLALSQYHREMLDLAAKSIEKAPSEERNILGYTLTLDPARFQRVRAMVDELYERIQTLSQELDADRKQTGTSADPTVYHVELALFPLTSQLAVKQSK